MSKATRVIPETDDEFEGDDEASVTARTYELLPQLRDVDPEAVAQRMADRLMAAGSVDELFDAFQGQSSDTLVGKSFEILSVAWQPYRSQRGIIPQAVVEAINLATGEVEEWVTTAKMPVTFLLRVWQLQAFPFKTRITEKTTTSGQKALNFERA